MANNWFEFKQFKIVQQHNAMKVATDACLFGALLHDWPKQGEGIRVLDVGTGTGLLSLMFAQRHPQSHITAIELHAPAAMEAQQNVDNAAFGKCCKVVNADFLNYRAAVPFDYIFSNPPFHENQLSSPNHIRNKAHHHETLTVQALLQHASSLLLPTGKISLLLPFYRKNEVVQMAETMGLYVERIWEISHSSRHAPTRLVLHLQKTQGAIQLHQLYIRNSENDYTPAFRELLQSYYLAF